MTRYARNHMTTRAANLVRKLVTNSRGASALGRASLVAVEWRKQTLREAGDLVLADPAVLPLTKIVELGELVTAKAHGRRNDDEITVYKSVGVGLQDIAIAGLAYARLAADQVKA